MQLFVAALLLAIELDERLEEMLDEIRLLELDERLVLMVLLLVCTTELEVRLELIMAIELDERLELLSVLLATLDEVTTPEGLP